ncbi:MAG: hypothetical protein GDA41_12815, partial [Rhodospirillales bacterium]|nr:hypothetical protein [Rhodospirillales bacterium]
MPGPAQSQTLTGLRITDVASGQQLTSVESGQYDNENYTVNTGLDLFRPAESTDAVLGRRFIRRLLDVTVASDNVPTVTFTDLGVRGNGVYRGSLESGERVAGTISGFGSAAFADPDAELIVSGTATAEHSGAPLGVLVDVSYETNYGAGGWRNLLRQMLYMESQYESARYAGATERLGVRDPIITSTVQDHIDRGDNKVDRSASVLSTDFRLYADGVDLTGGADPGCSGSYDCSIDLPGEFGAYQAVRQYDFTPAAVGNADVVQSHQGIHLALDRSGFSNAADAAVYFGAWM